MERHNNISVNAPQPQHKRQNANQDFRQKPNK